MNGFGSVRPVKGDVDVDDWPENMAAILAIAAHVIADMIMPTNTAKPPPANEETPAHGIAVSGIAKVNMITSRQVLERRSRCRSNAADDSVCAGKYACWVGGIGVSCWLFHINC